MKLRTRIGGKQTRLAEKRSTVPCVVNSRVEPASVPHFVSLPKSFPVCCSSSATASKPGKQSIEIRSRAVLITIDPFLDNQVGDLASKSEGAHIDSVLFEFTEKRCMNEASAIWDLKGFIATISVPCATE